MVVTTGTHAPISSCWRELIPIQRRAAQRTVRWNRLLSRKLQAERHPFRLTIALIQMGANGEVQPLETG